MPPPVQINVDATNRDGLRESLMALDSRVKHELRGSPHFHGEVSVAVKIKNGVIAGFTENVHKTSLMVAVKEIEPSTDNLN